MKVEFNEYPGGFDFTVTPETPEEVSKCARAVQNCKAEKPTMYLSFSSSPQLYISMNKIKEYLQHNSISNKK